MHWLLIGILLVSMGGFAGCGGGDDAAPAFVSPPAGTFTKTAAADGVQVQYIDIPFGPAQRSQFLVLPADVDGSGPVRSLAFRHWDNAASNICRNVTVKMGHVALDNLTTALDTNYEDGQGSLVTVYGTDNLVIPAGNATWFSIPLNGAFNYNGVDRFVVQVTTAGCDNGATSVVGHAVTNGTYATMGGLPDNATTGTFFFQDAPDMRLTFGGGGDAISYGGSAPNVYPFDNNLTDLKVQYLYKASEINGSGAITGIAFPLAETLADNVAFTATVRLGHAKRSSLTTAFDTNFSGATFSSTVTGKFGAGTPAGQYVWIPLNGYFNYNGTDNLVVEITTKNVSGFLRHRQGPDGTDNTYAYVYAGRPGTPDGPAVQPWQFDIKFRFAGGTIDVITAGNAFDPLTFPGAYDNGTSQYLYRQTELGSPGWISKVGFRLTSASVAGTYNNFTVKLAHTDKVAFDNSLSANAAGGMTVFSGTFNVPAGLKAGDWVEVPLTSNFLYDPSKNLVVQTTSRIGTVENGVRAGGGAAYLNRHGFRYGTPGDTASVNSFLEDLRLTIR